MKDIFKRCMKLVYPQSVGDGQLTGMIRVFYMGYLEGISNCDKQSEGDFVTAEIVLLGETLCDVEFVPDDSWKWWLDEKSR